MPPRLAQEQLQRVGRRLDRCRGDRPRRCLRRHLDDLDPPLVELANERLLLEAGQLVRLDDVAHFRRPDRARVLARLEKRSEIVLGQQAFDVDGRHGGKGRGTTTSVPGRFPQSGGG